jgi:cysteine desulfurase
MNPFNPNGVTVNPGRTIPGMAYLDHAASTPMRPEAVEAMEPFLARHAANPSGGHAGSRAAKNALEEARERVAALLGARPEEIVFTGGGSEGDNLAVKGAAWAALDRPRTDGVVTTGIEHKAVLGAVERLRRQGARVAVVPATTAGTVDLDRLAAALDDRTAVVSVMAVNNETGIVQPLDEVASLVRERAPRAALHTDAVQAPQWLDLGHAAAAVDLVAVSGHKFGGPKGVGALVRRNGVELVPLVEGGGHEWGLRAGTQNVAGIVAFAAALAVTHERREQEIAAIEKLRDRLEQGLLAAVPDLVVNGDPRLRVAGILHVAFPGLEAETLLVALDQEGIEAASGSACSSGAIDPSHVLVAMGLDAQHARASVRFSLGYASVPADVDAALAVVPRAVAGLRAATTV